MIDDARGISGGVGRQQLQRDFTIEPRVPGAEDLAERALADAFDHAQVAPIRFPRAGRRVRPPRDEPERRQRLELLEHRLVCRVRARVDARSSPRPCRRESRRPRPRGPDSASRFHFLRQAQQRTLRRLARGVGRRFPEYFGQLGIRVVHFHARDDGFALFRAEPRQRRLIPLEGLASDRILERRAVGLEVEPLSIDQHRRTPFPAQFVAQPVHHRLPQVGLQRADTPDLDALDLPKRPKEGVLDKVVRVGHVACPAGQPAADKTAQGAEMARHQALERLLVPLTHAFYQVERRVEGFFVGHKRGPSPGPAAESYLTDFCSVRSAFQGRFRDLSEGCDKEAVMFSPTAHVHRLIVSAGLALVVVPSMASGQTANVYELAFVHDSQIFKVRSDGTGLVQLTSEGVHSEPTWAPDGARIAFVRQQGGSLHLRDERRRIKRCSPHL